MISNGCQGFMILEDLTVSKESERIAGVLTGRTVYLAKTVNPASDYSSILGRGDSEIEARRDWTRRAEDRWQY